MTTKLHSASDNNPDEKDPELQAAVDHAAIAMLGKEVRGDTGGDPMQLERTRRAALEICRRAGILDLLQAVSADGVLRPPPLWPGVDVVPVGGGPQALKVAVRTMTPAGALGYEETIQIQNRITRAQFEAVIDRGKWYLRKFIDGRTQVGGGPRR